MKNTDKAPCPCCRRSCEVFETDNGRRTECNGCGTINHLAPAPKAPPAERPKANFHPKKFVPRPPIEGAD